MRSSLVKSYSLTLKILLGFGVFFFIFGIYYKHVVEKSAGWPTAVAFIERSYVDQSVDDGKTRYRAKIQYSYVVNGVAYKNNRVRFGNVTTKEFSEKTVSQYPEHSEVTIYYDPTDHAKSVIEPGANFVVKAVPVLGAFFILFSIALLKFGPRVFSAVGLFKKP